ncbi:MAG TPA: diacylglycerol kinase family protein [Symbiobacteriaceae bacterium]|nr:diacylglycerol kinase family protein [Symbiobacteriaceae bacterium]
MMRVLFIVNPTAGRGRALRTWKHIEKMIPRALQYDVAVPASCPATRRVAAEAARAGIERVIAVGGDGTLAAVAGELAHTGTSLGVVCAGTGNDFGRNCGLPRHLPAALEIALGKETQRIDLGLVDDGRHFINAAGIGFDAEVAAAASAYPTRLGGTLPYLLGALRTIGRYAPMKVEVTVDDQRFTGPATLVVVANGQHYGGGMRIAPYASHDDGKLDVCIAGALSRLEILTLLRQVYTGTHVFHPRVRMACGERIRVRVCGAARMHLDGDPGNCGEYAVQIQPGALSVAMPAAVRRAFP